MPARAHRSRISETPPLSVADLRPLGESWILDGEIRRHSPRTTQARRDLLAKFLWFLEARGAQECGTAEVRAFLAYINTGHMSPGGRWGNPKNTQPVSARTAETYFGNLRTFFRFVESEGAIDASPMERMRPPIARRSKPRPFSAEQVQALLEAAARSPRARRDVAILLLLLDTGARVSELCTLRYKDLDMGGRRMVVMGKGGKERPLPFGARAASALWRYLRGRPRAAGDPVFTSEGGNTPGQALTRSGVLQMIGDLGKAAGLSAVRCSPHTFRHTFGINFIRMGGDAFTLQELLGHESLDMTQTYVSIGKADAMAQHRRCSPADGMNLDPRKWGSDRRRR